MRHRIRGVIKAAFPLTVPVLTGYLVLGAAYGMLMNSIGYGWGWTFLASFTTYAGSMQFVAVSLIAAGFNPVSTALMTLMVNARHLFYSLSMLERFNGMGKIKPYLIFGLTDETFSVLSAHSAPQGIGERDFVLTVTVLNHLYWITGSVLGNLLGRLLPIQTKGLDFALTALFVVIFIDQWRTVAHRIPALIGIGSSLLALWLFGPDHFIIPTLFLILIVITAARRRLDARERSL